MIWAEISFFSKWWNDIDEQKRAMVKRRVKRFEFPRHCSFFLMLLFSSKCFRLLVLLCHWTVC